MAEIQKTTILNLAEKTQLDSADAFVIDTASGTKKITQENLIDDTLEMSGKLADAKAVGDAIEAQGTTINAALALKADQTALTAEATAREQADADLKADLSELDKTYTTTLPFTLVSDEYVVKGTGAFAAYGGWSRTDYIDLQSVIDFTPNKESNYSAFYDENKTYIQDVTFSANQKIDVPEGARYLCISGTTSSMSTLVIACTKNGAIKEVQNQIDDIADLVNSDTYFYPSSVITDAYVSSTGALVTNAGGYVASDYILLPFNESQDFQIRGLVYAAACCAIYDKNYNLLLAISSSNVEQYGGNATTGGFSVMTIPYIQGMKYARVSARNVSYTALTDLWSKGNTIVGAFERISSIETDLHSMAGNISTTIANSKVLVIGDSISTDTYGNYKKWVTDLKESGFLPSDVVNSSQHATGFVARYNNEANDFITRLKAIQNPETYDLVVVFGGINDYIQNIPMGSESGTDYTVSFKPAVNEFFSYLIQNFTQARLCVLLPLRTYATWRNTVGEYQQAYGDYIKTVAKSYCLPVLNLTEDSGFCPYITAFRDMWTLVPEGFDSSDGVHPNAEYERRFLAPMIKHFLQGLM